MLNKITQYIKLFIPPVFYLGTKSKQGNSELKDVQSKIESFGIEFPDDFKGFEYMNCFKYYDRGLSRLIKIVKEEKYNDLSLIDIGANIGDTIAVLRQTIICPILAIEGDDIYYEYLEKNTHNKKDIQLVKVFLGEKDDTLNMKFARSAGTAHVEKSNEPIEVLSLDSVLNTHSKFKHSKFIKIDTDGYDNKILRGSKKYLTDAKPVIFMEYDPNFLEKQNDYGIDIFTYLSVLGYEKAIMYQNFGEYMFSFDISNEIFIEEMREFFYKNKRIPYCDLCVFHKGDNDLFQKTRKLEMDYFKIEKINLSNYC